MAVTDDPVFEGPQETSATSQHACDECDFTSKTAAGVARHKGVVHGSGAPKKMGSPRSSGKTDTLRADAEAFCMFFYGLNGQLLSSVDPVCGQALMACQEPAAEAWYRAAKKNATVRKMLKSISNVGVWGGLVNAHMPIFMAVYAHHVHPMFAPADVTDETGQAGDGTYVVGAA